MFFTGFQITCQYHNHTAMADLIVSYLLLQQQVLQVIQLCVSFAKLQHSTSIQIVVYYLQDQFDLLGFIYLSLNDFYCYHKSFSAHFIIIQPYQTMCQLNICLYVLLNAIHSCWSRPCGKAESASKSMSAMRSLKNRSCRYGFSSSDGVF